MDWNDNGEDEEEEGGQQEANAGSNELVQSQEPTVLQYTRFHGLTVDYHQEQPRFSDANAPSMEALETDLRDEALDSPANRAHELTKERLAIDKEAAVLLKSVFDVSRGREKLQLDTGDLRERMSHLRLEIPILRTDPELDDLDFGNVDVPSFKDVRIPSEPVDVEKDEGFEWAAKYHAYPKKCLDQARAEKLNVSKDDLLFLSGALRDTYTAADSDRIKAESLEFERKTTLQPLTPPLLPLTPPLTPYLPSSPGNRLELLSEDSNSTLAELRVLEEQIFKEDVLVPPSRENSNSSDIMLLDAEGRDSNSNLAQDSSKESPPRVKRKAQDLKLESPLTPLTTTDSPAKRTKSVSFPDMLHEYIPDLPSLYDDGNNVLNSQGSFNDFFKEIEPLAEEAKRKVENEKLSEVDTVMRLDVPDMDFTLPIAPWNEFAQKKSGKHPAGQTVLDTQCKFITQVKRHYLKSATSWHGVGRLEREMHWSPFSTHMAAVTIKEQIHDEGLLSKLLEEVGSYEIVTSEMAVWKREGLRILEDDEESEEELELAESDVVEDERDDMQVLIRKRRLEMEKEDEEEVADVPVPNSNIMSRKWRAKKPKTLAQATPEKHERSHGGKQKPASSLQPTRQPKSDSQDATELSKAKALKSTPSLDNSLMFGGSFSATSALHKFMAVHGRAVKELGAEAPPARPNSKHIAATIQNLPNHSVGTSTTFQLSSTQANTYLEDHQEAPKVTPKAPLQLPPIPQNLPPAWFIISSTLLQHRSLLKAIEKTYPSANLLERDFTNPYSAAQEADILLSPSTGLIFTTLQQVKQRALPGQKDTSPLKQQVAKLQMRYERLVVLVSEGLSREMEDNGSSRPVDASDTDALTRFEVFTEVMEAEVHVQFVRGGEQALGRSMVVEMAKWGLPLGSKDMGDVKLLQDESFWELFLRRAGLNPFAAQSILSSLKDPYTLSLSLSSNSNSSNPPTSPGAQIEIFGLAAFVLMDAEERITRFQALLGGARILGRVGRKLDQGWPSAVHGFVV
ncbi:hypothetical protein P154DRAFT_449475 [Amniculicola lignicola CBS 123094]|uniref:Uncharacterized protein n=1 Tax=Amniculicola lignicola CBS 123094 TaxID=1392246 RepID=A0A6A5VWC6_9PLEO|nr:hypothetical protein P154DRAFT_449475 [Amniculicola lignicola CBS 123094]